MIQGGPKVVALVNSVAYVSAISDNELQRFKQQTATKIFKTDDSKNFQRQVENGQLEKPTAITTRKADFGYNIFAEHFAVLENLTGPKFVLRFMRQKNVVIVKARGPICSSHFTTGVKNENYDTSVKPQNVISNDKLIFTPTATKTVISLINYPSEWTTTGVLNRSEKFTKTTRLLILQSMSSVRDKKVEVRVTKTT